eukprot:824129-Amphidinium_carterae.1
MLQRVPGARLKVVSLAFLMATHSLQGCQFFHQPTGALVVELASRWQGQQSIGECCKIKAGIVENASWQG